MYFLKQIRTQFFSCIALFAGEVWNETSPSTRPQARPDTLIRTWLSPEQIAKLETLEGIKNEIAELRACEKIVGQRCTIFGNRLEQIKNNPTDQANASDPEFEDLLKMYEKSVEEYNKIMDENSQTAQVLEKRLNELEGKMTDGLEKKVDAEIAEIKGAVEEKDFTSEDVSSLEQKRSQEKETAEKTFITFLGVSYTEGTDISTYAQKFTWTPFEENFKAYMNVISKQQEWDKTDINTRGQELSYDIQEFQDITTSNKILLRDEKVSVDGKKFGEVRDESVQSQFEKFVSETKDTELKEILAPNGEVLKFSELKPAHIALLHEKGIDIHPFLFVNKDGKSIQEGEYEKGGVFYVNTAWNKNLESFLDISFLDTQSKTLKIEDQLAVYKASEDGKTGAYYYTNGEKVILRDGMKVEVIPSEENSSPDSVRNAIASEWFQDLMRGEIGSQVNQRPEILDILEQAGPIWKFLGELLVGLGFIKNPDGGGGYGYTDASGKWVPLDGKDFSESSRRSEPAERSASGTTLCSRTAFKNLTKLWASNPPRGASARESFQMYGKDGDTGFPKSAEAQGATIADLYVDASPKNAKYGHRVAAFKEGNQWFVLDPYYSIPWYSDRQGAIPAEVYLNHMCGSKGRKFWGAQYPNGNSSSANSSNTPTP